MHLQPSTSIYENVVHEPYDSWQCVVSRLFWLVKVSKVRFPPFCIFGTRKPNPPSTRLLRVSCHPRPHCSYHATSSCPIITPSHSLHYFLAGIWAGLTNEPVCRVHAVRLRRRGVYDSIWRRVDSSIQSEGGRRYEQRWVMAVVCEFSYVKLIGRNCVLVGRVLDLGPSDSGFIPR